MSYDQGEIAKQEQYDPSVYEAKNTEWNIINFINVRQLDSHSELTDKEDE